MPKVSTPFLALLTTAGLLSAALHSGSERPGPEPAETIVLDSTVLGATTVCSNLQVPWDIAWGPDGWIWFTEQRGVVGKVHPETGQRQTLLQLEDVFFKRSTGLLGLAVGVDPATRQTFVFLDYTYLRADSVRSKVVRYTYREGALVEPRVLLENIPGGDGHNGSRLVLAPDGKLFLSTGDATHGAEAQNPASLSGKILRLNPDGTVPDDNPVRGSYEWTRGHRNVQGLSFAAGGRLYGSEHGLANDDELNLIVKGKNYGWPTVTGPADTPAERAFCGETAVAFPLKAWTPTIAPAGIALYAHRRIPEWTNAVLMGTLKECDLRVLRLNATGDRVVGERVWADRRLGRLRDVCVAPNGDVFVATSNRDWNPTCEGFPRPEDDRIIRLRKVRTLRKAEQARRRAELRAEARVALKAPGERLYEQHCEACHKKGGQGVAGTFPPLAGSEWIKKDATFLRTVLRGQTGPVQVRGEAYDGIMPAFDFLSDQQLADVLTYVRQSFGNQEATITFKMVERVRAETGKTN